jgi:hypothetical protein
VTPLFLVAVKQSLHAPYSTKAIHVFVNTFYLIVFSDDASSSSDYMKSASK